LEIKGDIKMNKVIDLSEHNGNFNLQLLKDNGINEVILRLCWLGNRENHTQDLQVENYYNQAKNLNMKISFYVYSYCETLESLKSGLIYIDQLLEDLNVPQGTKIYLDLEDEQISYLSKEELTSQAEYFCNYYILRGYKSGIYANTDWFKNHLYVDRLEDYIIWLAQWSENKPNVNFKYDLWQFTSDYYINEKRFDCSYNYIEDGR
jgi:GH25 family lysozyme M1 (1,4-beta-N-acetylmuramidase)